MIIIVKKKMGKLICTLVIQLVFIVWSEERGFHYAEIKILCKSTFFFVVSLL